MGVSFVGKRLVNFLIAATFCLSACCCNQIQQHPLEPKVLKLGLVHNDAGKECIHKDVWGKPKIPLDKFLKDKQTLNKIFKGDIVSSMTPEERQKGEINDWSTLTGLEQGGSRLCGLKENEIRELFQAAFVREQTCQGVLLQHVAAAESTITPIKDIPGYVEIFYHAPAQWFYEVNYNGTFLGATTTDAQEAAKEICQTVKGMGGQISNQ
jgi:hypothetical protein